MLNYSQIIACFCCFSCFCWWLIFARTLSLCKVKILVWHCSSREEIHINWQTYWWNVPANNSKYHPLKALLDRFGICFLMSGMAHYCW